MSGESGVASTLYGRVIGEDITRVADPVRAFHLARPPHRWHGRAQVERGRNPIARFVGAIIGLPEASPDCALEVSVSGDATRETWARSFAGKPLVSQHIAGQGQWSGLIAERLGLLSFGYALAATDKGELRLDLRGWRAFGVPMPRLIGPRVVAFEHGADGRFNFDVEIGLPLMGRLVRYRGWLVPAEPGRSANS